MVFPGIYSFEKCEPENVTYRLDYNQEGIANKEDVHYVPKRSLGDILI